jgi:hypothetical protein
MGMLVGFVLGWAAAFIPCLWKKKPMPDLNWLTGGTAGRPCTDCTLAIRPGSMVWDIKAQTYIPREVCQSCDEARRQAAILASKSQTFLSGLSLSTTAQMCLVREVLAGRNFAARSTQTPPPAQP